MGERGRKEQAKGAGEGEFLRSELELQVVAARLTQRSDLSLMTLRSVGTRRCEARALM